MAENKHISIGRLGEEIAAGFLRNRGFAIIDRNYRKKFGELDIIVRKDSITHFIEVKSGSWSRPEWPHEGDPIYRPEDHMHPKKCVRMSRAIQAYCAEKSLEAEVSWTVDLIVVLINTETKKARVTVIPDILLDV